MPGLLEEHSQLEGQRTSQLDAIERAIASNASDQLPSLLDALMVRSQLCLWSQYLDAQCCPGVLQYLLMPSRFALWRAKKDPGTQCVACVRLAALHSLCRDRLRLAALLLQLLCSSRAT